MYIKIKNKKQEHKVLEKLGNEGYRWVTNVFPLDFKPSIHENGVFPLFIFMYEDTNELVWGDLSKTTVSIKAKDFLNPTIKTDNSKVNENLLKENEELKAKLCEIEELISVRIDTGFLMIGDSCLNICDYNTQCVQYLLDMLKDKFFKK